MKYAQEHKLHYLIPAVATTIAPCIFIPLTLGMIYIGPPPDSTDAGFWLIAYIVFFVFVFVAGIFDLMRRIELPALNRWIKRLEKTSVRWIDCFAGADPVSHGSLFDKGVAAKNEREIYNQSSVWKDHTSYWANRDEFVSLFFDELFQPELREQCGLRVVPGLTFDEERSAWIDRRRRFRVQFLRAATLILFISILAAILHHSQYWLDLLNYGATRFWGWLVETFGKTAKPVPALSLSGPALGVLALAFIPFWITGGLWRRWNEHEMRNIVQDVRCDGLKDFFSSWIRDFYPTRGIRPFVVSILLGVQIIVAAGIVAADWPPYWTLPLFGIPLFFLWFAPRDDNFFKRVVLDAPPISMVWLFVRLFLVHLFCRCSHSLTS